MAAATAPTTTEAPHRSAKQAAADYAALNRAEEGQSLMNYGLIFAGMMEKGIAEAEIRPRENVFTFRAWRAKSRIVNPGEKGVSVITFRRDDEGNSFPWYGTVFHESQTRGDTEPKPAKLEPTPEAEAHHQAQRDRAAEAKTEAATRSKPEAEPQLDPGRFGGMSDLAALEERRSREAREEEASKVAPVEPIEPEEAPTPEPEPEAVPVIDSGPQLTILPGDFAPAGYGVEPEPKTPQVDALPGMTPLGIEPADLAPDGTGAEPEPCNTCDEPEGSCHCAGNIHAERPWGSVADNLNPCPHTQRLVQVGMPCVACGDTCDD
jgi:hypothetical protein